jgi:signal transduction histidine kinase
VTGTTNGDDKARDPAAPQLFGQPAFANTVAHELRTPLTTVASLTDLLAETAERGTRLSEIVQALSRNVTRLQDIVEDLLELAGLESDTTRLDRSPVDLRELLSGRLASGSASAAARDVRVETDDVSTAASVIVLGDSARLARMIDYVVSAAVGNSSAGDVVIVRPRGYPHRWELDVQDQGQTDDAARQFATTIRRAPGYGPEDVRIGSGLGLMLARAIAERHDGTISVFDRGRQGTVVRITLPLTTVSDS